MGKSAIGKGISDYASHYWETFKNNPTYPWSGGVQDANYWMRTLYYQRQNLMDIKRPQIILGGLTGPYYEKRSAGGYYNPLRDGLIRPGTSPEIVTSTMLTAAALGVAGIRLFTYDRQSEVAARLNAPIGARLLTGANPYTSEVSHWRAMGYAANLLTKTLEPYVLGTAINSPAYGRNIVTAARQGPGGRMLLIVNGNDYTRKVNVDFAAYTYGVGATRYELTGESMASSVRPAGTTKENVSLEAGESVIYVFPRNTSSRTTDKVGLAPPANGAAKSVVNYNYLSGQHLPQSAGGVDCTSGCVLDIDRRLGDVYYQFSYLDGSNRVAGRSEVAKIAATDLWPPADTTATWVSLSPPGETASRMAASTRPESRKATIASGTEP
jgi:hypothetical protein